ncbi:MAG TPA: hypothetical protein VD757_00360, partial [Candidatus Nitrosocosmicus sp.]|nr:hypothetical protein [Candidatus Nitrosocosmicus sp.]
EKVKKPVTKKWWFWVLIIVLGLGVIGNMGGGTDKPANVPEGSSTEVGDAAPTPTKESEKKEPDIWIKEGMYKVGNDVAAGEYLIASNGSMAYFQVTSDSSGTLESIITNDNFGTFRYIKVKDGQYIEMKNAEMVPIEKAPVLQPVDGKYIPGMYKVGRDIEPGEYKVIPDGNGMSYVEVSSDCKGEFMDIVSNDNFDSEQYVTIKEGQYIKMNGCYIQM